jgi:hypothetical protein
MKLYLHLTKRLNNVEDKLLLLLEGRTAIMNCDESFPSHKVEASETIVNSPFFHVPLGG